MRRFDGRVAVVTGAGGGLGRAHALLLASEGAKVVINDYGGDAYGTRGTAAMADRVVAEIRRVGGAAVADDSDVAVNGSAVVQAALETFGRIDVVVNNAGTAGGGEFDAVAPEDFDRILAIHLGGTVAVTRAAWPHFKTQQYGRIVNTSSGSVYGLRGTSAYITAKAAIFGLTRALGLEGRNNGIKVNAIMPTAYSRLTAQSPELRPIMEAGFPAERVSPIVAALASSECPVTAETFLVGGGHSARVVLGAVAGATDLHTVDDVLQRFDEAMDGDVVVPNDALELLRYECELIGVTPAGL